jgi:hypothetical protein
VLTLQVIQEQVEYNETDFVFIFLYKIWVAASLFGYLLIA